MNLVASINTSRIEVIHDLCVHCSTLELANHFIKSCADVDVNWSSFPEDMDSRYGKYLTETCYRIWQQKEPDDFGERALNKYYISYAYKEYYVSNGCMILEWQLNNVLIKEEIEYDN